MKTIAMPPGLETKFFILDSGALDFLPELLETAFPGKRPWIVADENTWRAAGERAAGLLAASGLESVPPCVFPGSPRLHPDYAHSVLLAEKMESGCVPLAVGSGVINDLVKCAAGIRGIPYCCVPTACSVDGYTSFGAALSVNGTKKTVKCPAPAAVCADIGVLASAPPEMLASGYADLLTKIPAGADWLLADAVGEEPVREDVWQLIQGRLRDWVADRSSLLNIFNGLAATGFSMQMYRESRPASGAEHLFSHIWEMENLKFKGEEVSHGFKVGIGLLASSLLMEFVTEHDFEALRPRMRPGPSAAERREEIGRLLIRGCYGSDPERTAMEKFREGAALAERREFLASRWTGIQKRFRRQLIPFSRMREMLRAAGCPAAPSEIGLSEEQFLHGIRAAQLIRIRYTVIDFLYELGLLEEALKTLGRMM